MNIASDCNFAGIETVRAVCEEYFWVGDSDVGGGSGDTDTKELGTDNEPKDKEVLEEGDEEEDVGDDHDERSPVLDPSQFVVCAEAEKERAKIANFRCCVRRKVKTAVTEGEPSTSTPARGCISQFSYEEIYHKRMQMAGLSEEMKDMMLIGMLSVMKIHQGEMTDRPKQKTQSARQKTRIQDFTLDGHVVCKEAFQFLLGISNNKFVAVKKHFLLNGREPRTKRAGGRNKSAYTAEETISAVSFLKAYADMHALGLPGRVPGFRDSSILLLPSAFTKKGVWEAYRHATEDAGQRAMALSTFKSVWKQFVPYIVVARPMTDLCWTCQKNNTLVHRSANLHEETKLGALAKQQEHLRVVEVGRALYREQVQRGKTETASKSVSGLGRANEIEWAHYSFDFAQNVHYPSSPMQAGPIYFLVPRKCHIFGVCCEVFPKQVNYLIDEGMMVGKGSNTVISYLDHFFPKYGLGEKDVSLHCDNCSGQNKNRHNNIELNFMVAGHTKFSPDLCFGLLKRKYRRSEVHCLDDMKKTVEDSSAVNLAEVVGTENGAVSVAVYDWQSFFAGFQPLPGIKKHHSFRFSSATPGVVHYKIFSDSPTSESYNIFKDPWDGDYPPILPAPGLSAQRQTYLYEKIREFVREDARDVTCPAPL